MTVYLDNDIVSAIVKDDYPAESEALDRLLEVSDAGKLKIVTSELTRREIERYQGQQRKGLQKVYSLIGKVNFLEDHKVLGFHSDWNPYGGESYPLVEDDPISSVLRQMGLERTDAHHLMLATCAKCDVFLTCDGRTILSRRDVCTMCGGTNRCSAVRRLTDCGLSHGKTRVPASRDALRLMGAVSAQGERAGD